MKKEIKEKYKKAWAIKTKYGDILYPIFRTKKEAVANCKDIFAEIIKIQIKEIKEKIIGKPCPRCSAILTNLGCPLCIKAMEKRWKN